MKKDRTEEKEHLEGMYLRDHLTMDAIGSILGITRQAVHARMRRLHIDTSQGERFTIQCYQCGKDISITRARFKKAKNHFCQGSDCYGAYLRGPELEQQRADKRLAKIAEEERNGTRPRGEG